MKINFTYKNIILFLLAASVFALMLAYISQYFFDLQPCILCFHQRKPFFVIIALTSLALFVPYLKNHKLLLIELSMIALLINAAIGLYHVGVEKKIFKGPTTCSNISSNPTTMEELKMQLKLTKPVRCDTPQFVSLKISMAGWNVLYCLMLITATIVAARRVE